jgi:hypothetical protein
LPLALDRLEEASKKITTDEEFAQLNLWIPPEAARSTYPAW